MLPGMEQGLRPGEQQAKASGSHPGTGRGLGRTQGTPHPWTPRFLPFLPSLRTPGTHTAGQGAERVARVSGLRLGA